MLRALLATRGGRAVVALLAGLALAVAAGLVALWPDGGPALPAPLTGPVQRAEVETVSRRACPISPRSPCQRLGLRVADGPGAGERAVLTLSGTDLAPEVSAGDTLRVLRTEGAPEPYAFVDFERRSPLVLLAVLFAVLVVALARGQGVRSLVGLAVSLVLITQFVVPAILAGEPPLLVAVVGALAVMFVTLALAHGVGATSVAAAAGASCTLLVTAGLALLFVELARITGFSSEEATLLTAGVTGADGPLSLSGLVLAGIVVGALGVLDDVTVSQASVVLALRRADPAAGFRRLFASALTVGRDHLSATVNTLVLAYVGAALPVLLVFEAQGTGFGDALNRESVAEEVVAMLVGSIGLVLAVPVTTALAAWLVRLVPARALPAGHGHAH